MAMIWTDQTKEGSRRRKAINEEAAKRLAAFYAATCARLDCGHDEGEHMNYEGQCTVPGCRCPRFQEVEL